MVMTFSFFRPHVRTALMLKYEELSRDRRTEKLIVDMQRKSLRNANMRTGVIAYELKVANDYEESIRGSNDQNQQELAHERVDHVQKALDDAIKEQGRRRQQLKQGRLNLNFWSHQWSK